MVSGVHQIPLNHQPPIFEVPPQAITQVSWLTYGLLALTFVALCFIIYHLITYCTNKLACWWNDYIESRVSRGRSPSPRGSPYQSPRGSPRGSPRQRRRRKRSPSPRRY